MRNTLYLKRMGEREGEEECENEKKGGGSWGRIELGRRKRQGGREGERGFEWGWHWRNSSKDVGKREQGKRGKERKRNDKQRKKESVSLLKTYEFSYCKYILSFEYLLEISTFRATYMDVLKHTSRKERECSGMGKNLIMELKWNLSVVKQGRWRINWNSERRTEAKKIHTIILHLIFEGFYSIIIACIFHQRYMWFLQHYSALLLNLCQVYIKRDCLHSREFIRLSRLTELL